MGWELAASRCSSAAPPFSAPEPWAPASPRTWPTPEFPRFSSILLRSSELRSHLGPVGPRRTLAKSKPAAFFEPSLAALIAPGNFRRRPAQARPVRLDHRSRRREPRHQDGAARPRPSPSRPTRAPHHQHLRPAHRAHRRRDSRRSAAASSARTSSIRRATCACSKSSPPPTATLPLVAAFAAFADRVLGKQVVFAHDTPNFIANRIGIAVMFSAANLMLEQGL